MTYTFADFKARFTREFVYGTRQDQVQEDDVNRAIEEAKMVFNEDLWETSEVKVAFSYAAAHFMVLNIQAAGGLIAEPLGLGIENQGGGVVASKSLGSAALSFALPTEITENATLSQFMRTDFGQRYLQLLAPRLVGGGFVVDGKLKSEMGLQ